MVRVDTDAVTLEVKGILAELGVTKLILVQVRPSPYPGIDHMGKPLPAGHLEHTGSETGNETLHCTVSRCVRHSLSPTLNPPSMQRLNTNPASQQCPQSHSPQQTQHSHTINSPWIGNRDQSLPTTSPHLQPPIQSPLNGHTFRRPRSPCGNCRH